MPNSIDFCKGTFLRVIPVHIIVSWSDIDLWNIDLLHTHLDLWDTDIPIFFVSKTSWRCFQSMFSGRLQDMSSRYVFNTSSKHVFKTSSTSSTSSRRLAGCLQDVLEDEKLLRWTRIEDVFKTCLDQDVLKTNKCLLGQWLIKIKLRNIQLIQHVRMCHTYCFGSDPASKRMKFQLSLNRTFCPTPAPAITNFCPSQPTIKALSKNK